ncbi:MAG: putative heme iron utilization protein [Polyangiales bacterium]|jgi:putative heme iron utilization protein
MTSKPVISKPKKIDGEHGRTTPEEPLTPPERKAPSHAERARTLMGQCTTGTLSTLSSEGYPHGSYVTFALDGDSPVFLVSKLAAHTNNLEGDSRASLLVHETGASDPLANGRVTLLGRCIRLEEDASARAAFLEQHPGAAYYVDFRDFGFFGLQPESIRYIGGYGRMSWVEGEEWSAATADPLAAAAAGIIEHMNDDHADALVDYAKAFTREDSPGAVTLQGVDRYGFDMSVVTERGPRPARVVFDVEVLTPGDCRKAFVDLVKRARAQLKH